MVPTQRPPAEPPDSWPSPAGGTIDLRPVIAGLEAQLTARPSDHVARRRCAMLLVQVGEIGRARVHLKALALGHDVPATVRDESAHAVAIIDHNSRILRPLSDAVRTADLGPLVAALEGTPATLLAPDDALLARLETMASGAPEASARSGWDAVLAGRLRWPVIEAHFEEHLGDSVEQVGKTLGRVARATRHNVAGDADAQSRALITAASAIAERDELGWLSLGAPEWEARIRYFHAQLNVGKPGAQPGMFKPLPNRVRANPKETRGDPRRVIGTLRAFDAAVRAKAAPGFARAALWIYLFAKLHPFIDGNGGMGRFLASRELVAIGAGPLIVPDEIRETVNVAIRHAHAHDDVGPLVAALVASLDWRDRFVESVRRFAPA